MGKWIKLLFGGKVGLIKMLDELEGPLAEEGAEIQKKVASVSPSQVSKYLIDKFQLKLCKLWKVNPKDVDPSFPSA